MVLADFATKEAWEAHRARVRQQILATAGLDPIGAQAFDQLIKKLQQRLDLTVFLITHDLDSLYAICDRVAVLADQQVIAVDTIKNLLTLDHPWIQEYFNGPRGRAAAA